MASSETPINTPVPPELKPYYEGTKKRSWLRWAIRIIVVVALIVLLILGIIWLTHRNDASDKAKTDTSSQPDKKTTAKTPATPQSSDSKSSDTKAATNPDSATSDTTAATEQPESIPNTGPGETLGLFVMVSVTGAIAYQVRLRSKPLNH